METIMSTKEFRKEFKYAESLCWHCQNSVPGLTNGCSWSRDFQPIVGWKAQPVIQIVADHTNISYHVMECPLFDAEPDREEAPFDDVLPV